MTLRSAAGTVAALWRYPVKSMMGESVPEAALTARGLHGDRGHAIVDLKGETIASAKRMPRLFEFRAGLMEDGRARITLPDGDVIASDHEDCGRILSRAIGREVTLRSGGAFHDGSAVHLLTTATLARLEVLFPDGRFDPRRFRPNIVIDSAPGRSGFVENDWIGRTLAIGGQVRLGVTKPCERCVMTTLPQGDLPSDPGILKTVVRHNQAHVGVYAKVLREGTIRPGDAVTIEDR